MTEWESYSWSGIFSGASHLMWRWEKCAHILEWNEDATEMSTMGVVLEWKFRFDFGD